MLTPDVELLADKLTDQLHQAERAVTLHHPDWKRLRVLPQGMQVKHGRLTGVAQSLVLRPSVHV